MLNDVKWQLAGGLLNRGALSEGICRALSPLRFEFLGWVLGSLVHAVFKLKLVSSRSETRVGRVQIALLRPLSRRVRLILLWNDLGVRLLEEF